MNLVLIALGVVATAVVATFVVVLVALPLAKGIRWLAVHLWKFISGEIADALRVVGAIITGVFFAVLCVLSLVVGRWSASKHFAESVVGEGRTGLAALYRVVVGHPARLLGLSSLTEGIEGRLPAALAAAPRGEGGSGRAGQFEGYRILGTLPTGGSGARLYIAEPDEIKRAALKRSTGVDAGQVVIKAFSAEEAGGLAQIVRESRSLEAARRLGLILDHELSDARFYYVMRYVPGRPLTAVARQLHAEAGGAGLSGGGLGLALGYVADLLGTLEAYHAGGLWHKDVKPDNIIVDGPRAHLVDFGLVTPLRSAMTLTTHGTEYFRDPEMVRMALRGAKVHEVDGTRFDIYGAGAVLYALLEDSFPAHGVLSPFSKSSPEALRWIVRRAMADYDKRYASVGEMLADVRVVMGSADPAGVRPAELPSMRGGLGVMEREVGVPPAIPAGRVAGGAAAGRVAEADAGGRGALSSRSRPGIRVVNWWTGKSEPVVGVGVAAGAPVGAAAGMPGVSVARRVAEGPRKPAGEQLAAARGRAEVRRAKAHARRATARAGDRYTNSPSWGHAAAIVVVAGLAVGGFYSLSRIRDERAHERRAQAIEARERLASASAGGEIGASQGVHEVRHVEPFGDGRRILVVSDVLPPMSESRRAELDRVAESLGELGFDVLGVGEAADAERALLAEVRARMGTTPVDSSQASEALAEWMQGRGAEVGAVVWASPAEGDAGVSWRVFSSDAGMAGRLVEALSPTRAR